MIDGAGTLSTLPGAASTNAGGVILGAAGAPGRIRLETFQRHFSGRTQGNVSFAAVPGLLTLPDDAPLVRVTHVNGVEVPANPTGSFPPADLAINSAGATTFDIAAQSIPPGTVVTLTLIPDGSAQISVDSTPLEGTLEASTATASVSVPHGFSRVLVQATWEP